MFNRESLRAGLELQYGKLRSCGHGEVWEKWRLIGDNPRFGEYTIDDHPTQLDTSIRWQPTAKECPVTHSEQAQSPFSAGTL